MTPIGTVEVRRYHADLWVVALVGEHDLSTADVIKERLTDVHSQGTRVILDLSQASFVDTSVIAVIVSVVSIVRIVHAVFAGCSQCS